MKIRRIWIVTGLTMCITGSVFTQETEDLISMSLEDILNLNIVSASKRAENVFESPLSASVITRDDIENSGATTFEELFRLVPGLLVREESHGNFDIHIRGYDNIPPGNLSMFSENTMSLVMIDGRKVFNHLMGGTFWESLPVSLDDIERIEIIRGSANSLYGPNAVTGVVHIITRKAGPEKLGVRGTLLGGVPETSTGSLCITSHPHEKLGLSVNAHGEKRNRFDNDYYEYGSGSWKSYESLTPYMMHPAAERGYPVMEDTKLARERWGISGRMSWGLSESVQLDVQGGFQDSRAQTVFMETLTTPFSFRSSRTGYIQLVLEAWGFHVQMSDQTGTQDILEGSEEENTYDMRVTDGILEYNWQQSKFSIRPGISVQEVRYNDLPHISEENTGLGYFNAKRYLGNYAYFMRTEYQPAEALRFVAGIRSDHYNYPDTVYVNYQLAGTWRVRENHMLRAVYSRANRGPFFMDIYTDFSESNNQLQLDFDGNRNLRLPLTDMIELGYRGRLTDHVQVDLETFYTETHDITSFEPEVFTLRSDYSLSLTYIYKNLKMKVRQLGISGNASWTAGARFRGRVFATWQQTRLIDFDWKTTPMVIDPDSHMFLLPRKEQRDFVHENTPAVYGGLLINYRAASKWNLSAGFYFLGAHVYRYDYATTNESYGQAELDARIIPTLHISYKFDKQYSAFVTLKNPLQNQREFGFAETIGLSVYGGLRWNRAFFE
ncbi:TonB-dependent receptor [bacterium]|nr:TonB-dependent receptor [bacterium]